MTNCVAHMTANLDNYEVFFSSNLCLTVRVFDFRDLCCRLCTEKKGFSTGISNRKSEVSTWDLKCRQLVYVESDVTHKNVFSLSGPMDFRMYRLALLLQSLVFH